MLPIVLVLYSWFSLLFIHYVSPCREGNIVPPKFLPLPDNYGSGRHPSIPGLIGSKLSQRVYFGPIFPDNLIYFPRLDPQCDFAGSKEKNLKS